VILGEGACVLVLEDLESARTRGAEIYAEVKGSGNSFDAYRVNKYKREGSGLKNAMRLSLKEAQLRPEDIDYICAGANSTRGGDLLEAEAIKEVFGLLAKKVPVSAIKSMIGEVFSASGSLQVASAAAAIENQMIPPTINYQEKDERCALNLVVNEAGSAKIENVLVNAFGPSGCNSSMVISRFK